MCGIKSDGKRRRTAVFGLCGRKRSVGSATVKTLDRRKKKKLHPLYAEEGGKEDDFFPKTRPKRGGAYRPIADRSCLLSRGRKRGTLSY